MGERPLQRTASDTAVVESSARIWENPKRSGRSALVYGVVAQSAEGTLQASVARTLSVTMKRRLRLAPERAMGGTGVGVRGPGCARSTWLSCRQRAEKRPPIDAR